VRRVVVLAVIVSGWLQVAGLQAAQDARPTFRSSVERVAVTATVRDRHGKPVTNLTAADFELLDDGQPRPITEFRTEPVPVSLALLVDFSGSMDVAARRQAAHDNAFQLLSWLRPGTDQAGLFVFDRQLHELQPIAPVAPANILQELDSFARPYGATSLFDAIAETGRRIAATGVARRAVVALTDGADNASRLTAEQVSGIASSIDVPVYIVIVVSPYDRAGRTTVDDARLLDGELNGPLANLARWTGGELYVGVGPAQSAQAAQQIVSDLREQYLIGFEPSPRAGWHPIELRVKGKDLVVHARSGYVARAADVP
jgi:VWFA-related protein